MGRTEKNAASKNPTTQNSNSPAEVVVNKMSAHRLHKLLTSKIYRGLCTEVVLESPCFQLGPTGEIIRHVHIGVTKREFIIAHQTIRDVREYPELMSNPNVDLDLEGFELLCCVPLAMTHFSLWDDRSCRIAICTDMGSSYYFEMCNVIDGSDDRWAAWREYISKKGDNFSDFGYKSWQIYQSDSDKTRRVDYSNVKFLKRPAALCLVESVGTQACEDFDYFQENQKFSLHYDHLHLHEAMLKALEGSSLWDMTSALYTSIPDLQFIGKSRQVIQVASDLSLTESKDEQKIRKHSTKGSKSENDLVVRHKTSGKPIECWKNRIFYLLLQIDSENASTQVSVLFPDWSMSEQSLREYTKIWQARSKRQLNKAPLSFQPVESLSLDDIHPIIDILDDSGHAKTYPRTRHRRRHVSKRGLSTRVLGVFKTRSARRLNPQLEDFPTNQIANELTLMASDVLLVVTEEDLMAYQCGTHLNDLYRLKGLTNYSENVVRFVVNEVLSGENPKDQARIIRYCLKVGEHCQNLQNLLTLACILKSLYSVAVSRLTETWNVFRQEYIDAYRKFKEMTQIFSPQNHFKDYAEVYAVICESDLPYLPWFDHFLWHSYYVFSKNVATDVDKTQTLTKQYLADTRSLKRGKMSTFSRLICCISDADSEVDLKMPLSSVTKMENIESNSKKNNKSFSKKVTCCVNRIPSEVILSVNSSETVTASSEIKLFVSPDKHVSEINIAAILSDDEISSLNMNSEGCKKVQNSSRKRFSKSESNIDYRCKKENNQSLNSVQWSEFQDVALDDSDEEVDNICLQSVNGNNAQTRDLDTSKVRLNTRRLEEKEVDKNQVVTKAYDNPPQDVTPKQDAPSSNTSHRFKIMRKPIIRLEEKSPEVPVNEITKNTVSLVTSKSSPTMTGRNINDKKERPRKPCSTELSSLAHLEGDNAQEGTQGAGEENPEILELKPEVMTPSSIKCNVCCREMCMYGATAIGELLQMQLAALKYAMKSNTTARAYITRPIPNSYQLLQMSLRQKPPPKNDFKKKSRSEK